MEQIFIKRVFEILLLPIIPYWILDRYHFRLFYIIFSKYTFKRKEIYGTYVVPPCEQWMIWQFLSYSQINNPGRDENVTKDNVVVAGC